MDFGDNTKMSRNKVIGIGVVVLLHAVLIYALVTGLATSAVEMIKKPLEIKIVQAPPPPPVKPPPPPPPTLTTPPPPYIPPPIVNVDHPPPPKPVFAVTAAKPSPAPTAVARPVSIGVVCPNISDVAQQLEGQFENISQSEGINSASVTVQFSVTAGGEVINPHVIYSTFPGLNSLALQGVKLLACHGQGQTVQVTAPFVFGSD